MDIRAGSPHIGAAPHITLLRLQKVGQIRTGKLPTSKFRRVEMAQSQIERNVNSCLATLNPHNPIR
ncbi:hypothetical protein MKL73_07600 [Brucella abortus]|uniref:Uncharacterized protein n=3 Tax=Brucella abortus TaxID=235 RepID=Q2YR46_BRUA2|nr:MULTISPECIES: hypothetical protein [Brucella]AAX75302.1 hypothetical protein BruAb1_2000 [Brucella abortus bv. 1 str. 9-941]ASU72648.1 hypothetical protein CJP69_00810 [Brucella abortus]ASU75610.1 hypothetical protein CJP70_10130 [Brucella abortus]ASZ87097.1 hypothetical protein CK802_02560 [Brucella abortus]ASZ89995.1 hypothetical protein CK803_02080 [Brucella abortus]